MSIGFVAELVIAYRDRDSKPYSIAERAEKERQQASEADLSSNGSQTER